MTDAKPKDFDQHKYLESIIENIADCSQMPRSGAYALALPLRAEEAAESPIRIIGLVF